MSPAQWREIEYLAFHAFGPHVGGPDLVDPYKRERDLAGRLDGYLADRRFAAWQRSHRESGQ